MGSVPRSVLTCTGVSGTGPALPLPGGAQAASGTTTAHTAAPNHAEWARGMRSVIMSPPVETRLPLRKRFREVTSEALPKQPLGRYDLWRGAATRILEPERRGPGGRRIADHGLARTQQCLRR